MTETRLRPLVSEDRNQFILDNQEAFRYGGIGNGADGICLCRGRGGFLGRCGCFLLCGRFRCGGSFLRR